MKTKRSTSTKENSPQLRLRIFAGPNGSGKSTIINSVRGKTIEGRPIDFGFYINADEITKALKKGKFSFGSFSTRINSKKFSDFATASGLLGGDFEIKDFHEAYYMRGNSIILTSPGVADRVGQIIARFLREEMLRLKRRFSFETVFSHESNLDIMKRARSAGYKVYLYFVSTESPTINKYRVELRVKEDGHDVPPEKIESRYYKSLDLMFHAAQESYQAFFFDNSKEDEPFELVAHFKKSGEKKSWDKIDKKKVPNWFRKYYSDKVKRKRLRKNSNQG